MNYKVAGAIMAIAADVKDNECGECVAHIHMSFDGPKK